MAKYDNVICEYPLPGGVKLIEFQTKSTSCKYDTYKIDRDGQLWINHKIDDKSKDITWLALKISLDIEFYTCQGLSNKDTFRCYRYKASFEEGKLTLIVKLKNEIIL